VTKPDRSLGVDQPAAYRIQLQGWLDVSWSDWFDDMAFAIQRDQNGAITTLTGVVRDQVALHGLLARIRDLGLPLLRLERVTEKAEGDHRSEEKNDE